MEQITQHDALMAQALTQTAANLHDRSDEMMVVISSFSVQNRPLAKTAPDRSRAVPAEPTLQRRAA